MCRQFGLISAYLSVTILVFFFSVLKFLSNHDKKCQAPYLKLPFGRDELKSIDKMQWVHGRSIYQSARDVTFDLCRARQAEK